MLVTMTVMMTITMTFDYDDNDDDDVYLEMRLIGHPVCISSLEDEVDVLPQKVPQLLIFVPHFRRVKGGYVTVDAGWGGWQLGGWRLSGTRGMEGRVTGRLAGVFTRCQRV